VILTTAYESYALKGFELEVCDYLLKPISFNRFVKAVNKVYDIIKLDRQVSGNNKNNGTKQKKTEKYIFLKADYKLVKVFLDDILYVEGLKEYLIFYTTGKKIITRLSFKEAEKILPSHNFMRVHKSYIVALSKINSVERNRIKISDKSIPLSDTYKKNFYELL